MNIEEERRAFAEVTKLNPNSHYNEFYFWIAAKAHAEEVAKLAARIAKGMNP